MGSSSPQSKTTSATGSARPGHWPLSWASSGDASLHGPSRCSVHSPAGLSPRPPAARCAGCSSGPGCHRRGAITARTGSSPTPAGRSSRCLRSSPVSSCGFFSQTMRRSPSPSTTRCSTAEGPRSTPPAASTTAPRSERPSSGMGTTGSSWRSWCASGSSIGRSRCPSGSRSSERTATTRPALSLPVGSWKHSVQPCPVGASTWSPTLPT
jgi:hypothetical protein